MGLMDNFWSTTTKSSKDETSLLPSETTPINSQTQTISEGLSDVPGYIKKQTNKLFQLSSPSSPQQASQDRGTTEESRHRLFSYHILAFVGGIAMTLTALIDPLLNFSPPELLICIYTFGLGLVIIILEIGDQQQQQLDKMTRSSPSHNHHSLSPRFIRKCQKQIKFYFRILDFTWGRGCLYVFAGSLMISNQHPDSRINRIVGIYMIMVGGIAIMSSYNAASKLVELHRQIDSKRDLKRLFAEYDTNGDGALSEHEFAALLCRNLDVDSRISYHEIAACFNAIDKNDDGNITYDEFKSWWNNWGSKSLRRSKVNHQGQASLGSSPVMV